jgi:hypothetical protein
MEPMNQHLWPDPATDLRARRWIASVNPGDGVTVSHMAVLSPGEQLTEYPETWTLTAEEWAELHEARYGLTLAGEQLGALAERRAAWRKVRRMANGDLPYTEASVREAFGAMRRILRDLTEEVQD